MLTSQQNVPRIIFMQTSRAAIIENKIFHVWGWKSSHTMIWYHSYHNKTIVDMIKCVYDSLICKLLQALLRNLFFTLSRPILHITAQIKSPDPCFQRQRSSIDHSWITYVCLWHVMQILKSSTRHLLTKYVVAALGDTDKLKTNICETYSEL